jgi:hypothetical protein
VKKERIEYIGYKDQSDINGLAIKAKVMIADVH